MTTPVHHSEASVSQKRLQKTSEWPAVKVGFAVVEDLSPDGIHTTSQVIRIAQRSRIFLELLMCSTR